MQISRKGRQPVDRVRGSIHHVAGAYTVRFVVRDQSTGRIGTADASFVIRNLARNAQRP